MQTFVPYGTDFVANAQVLDRQRLGKQRVEGYQILRCLLGVSSGWRHHPAVKMWAGHEGSLGAYVLAVCEEWVGRGYSDTVADKTKSLLSTYSDISLVNGHPDWLDFRPLTMSHRSNLVRKLPSHYRGFWPHVRDDIPYIWPV